jgi:hypothetical protein
MPASDEQVDPAPCTPIVGDGDAARVEQELTANGGEEFHASVR